MTESKINKWFQIGWRGITIFLFGTITIYTGTITLTKSIQNIITNPAQSIGEITGTAFILYIITKYITITMIKEITKKINR